MSQSAISRYMSKLGKKGAKTTNANLTPEERKASARKAAQARWAKNKQKTS